MAEEARTGSHNGPAPQGSGSTARRRPARLSLIVAMTPAGVIGRDNELPWRLPDDLKRFKALTLGKPVIMGRRTWESIGRPLPGRTSIVMSRSATFAPEGAIVVPDLERALDAAGAVDEAFVIGGAQVYALALPLAQRVYLTVVHGDVQGDARFPALDPLQWCERERIERPVDERHAFAMTFSVLERAGVAAASR